MSKAEEILKNRLERLFRAQARYILDDNTINDNQKMEQMMLIEDLIKYMRGRCINDLPIHEYSVNRTLTQEEMDRIEEEEMGYNRYGNANKEGRD